MKPPIPANEADRLKELRLFRILDTTTEQTLDNLTVLAAEICETPISLISLVDENRQWFKSKVGLEVNETPRDVAFCAHAINTDEIFIVEDTAKDTRFAQNPLVTDDPSIRFYAGAPLIVSGGIALGTLCVIDRKPRHLTERQRNALNILREAVVTQLNLRRIQAELQDLQTVLPLCAWCRSIKSEDGSWINLQDFIEKNASVTHGMCPNCADNFSLETKKLQHAGLKNLI